MSDVQRLLARLAAGEVSLGDVAIDFASRKWPQQTPPVANYDALAVRELDDPEPILPGSWGEVEAAYAAGKITDRQYGALYEAKTSGHT